MRRTHAGILGLAMTFTFFLSAGAVSAQGLKCPDNHFSWGPWQDHCWVNSVTITLPNLGAWAASMPHFAECEADCKIAFTVAGNDPTADKWCPKGYTIQVGEKCKGQSTSPQTKSLGRFTVYCGRGQNWDYWTCCEKEATKRCQMMAAGMMPGATSYICCKPMNANPFPFLAPPADVWSTMVSDPPSVWAPRSDRQEVIDCSDRFSGR